MVAVTKIQIMKLQKNWQMEREEFGFSQFRYGKKRIADSKATYYEVLQESSYNWKEKANDYEPFLTNRGLSKSDRVREIIKNSFGKITKTETVVKCPDITQRERRYRE